MTTDPKDIIHASGGRKFLLAAAVTVLTAVLQAFGRPDADGTTYAAVLIGVAAAYITGNVVQRVKSPGKESP